MHVHALTSLSPASYASCLVLYAQTHSTMSTSNLEEVAAAHPAGALFQLYVIRDRNGKRVADQKPTRRSSSTPSSWT